METRIISELFWRGTRGRLISSVIWNMRDVYDVAGMEHKGLFFLQALIITVLLQLSPFKVIQVTT